MKKNLYLLASMLLLSFTSCTDEVKEMKSQQSQFLKQVVMTTQDFELEANSRTLYQITDGAVQCTWAANDTVGVFPNEGGQVYFPMVSGKGTKNAIFNGGGWALKDGSAYGAYFPFVGDIYLNKHAIPVNYTGQTQVGNGSMAHLGGYDYMVAPATTPEFGSANFMFKHLSALVQLKLTVPQPATLTSIKLVAETDVFVVKGTVDVMTATPNITPKTTNKTVKLNLQNIATTENNQVITLYMMISPVDLSSQSLKAVVMTDKGVENVVLESKNFQAGKVYTLSGHINDKNQSNDEDEIVGDGTFKDGVVSLSEAGTMKQLLGDDYLSITSLKVIGPINGDDVYYLRRMTGGSNFKQADRGKLTTLDLSEASIVEGGEWYYDSSSKRYYTSNNTIGDNMFYACENLQKILLPNSVTSIGVYAFGACSSLTSVTIGNRVVSIGNSAFGACSSLTSIDIPDSVNSIGDYAFSACKSLKLMDIPNSVTSIGYKTFSECSWLTSVTIGDGVTAIGDYAFYNCYSISTITIGDSVTSIGDYAFNYCSSLTSIDIPNSVTSIGEYAFNDCI